MNLSDQYFELIANGGFQTGEVAIGNITMGFKCKVRLQSMTTTNTQDINSTVEQCKRIFDAGADLVRITTPAIRDAKILREIKELLLDDGYNKALVADVHYNANVAEMAAKYVEKVRINPGNYTDKNSPAKLDYSREEYLQELLKIENRIKPLISICKKNGTCIRIGTNHGSLSNRILSRCGGTPLGMVESTMEFLRIFQKERFNNLVISLKSSNTRVMVYANRLLAATMKEENMNYPIHLGVTEAGDGEDGRLKSAIGIGTLLADGIGDTIRVSLTEDPEKEIPVASKIANFFNGYQPDISLKNRYDPFEFNKKKSNSAGRIGGDQFPVVVFNKKVKDATLLPDYVLSDGLMEDSNENIQFIEKQVEQITTIWVEEIKLLKNIVLVLRCPDKFWFNKISEALSLHLSNVDIPILLRRNYNETNLESLQIKAACDFGPFLIDGKIDGIFITNSNSQIANPKLISLAFGILQASRSRITKPDYISCPGCGRTLFDLHKTTSEIKQITAHLQGVKIGIMGCIVNGPGEMADADFGYIGSGPGKVSLYRQKEMVKKNVPETEAVAELIDLIKRSGKWKE